MTNIDTNYGFDKCGSFAEIAQLALHRALELNDTGLVKVNIRITCKEISVNFYKGSTFRAVHFIDGSFSMGGHTKEDLDRAFLDHEALGKKEVKHA